MYANPEPSGMPTNIPSGDSDPTSPEFGSATCLCWRNELAPDFDVLIGELVLRPDRRWQFARRAAYFEPEFKTSFERDDPISQVMVDWVERLRIDHSTIARHHLESAHPDLLAAIEFRVLAPWHHRWELESRLIANQARIEIGDRFGLSLPVVTMYERLFFDLFPIRHSKIMMQEFAVAVRDPDRNALEHLWKSMAFQDGLHDLEIALRVMQEYELVDPDSINAIRWHQNWRIRDTMLKAIRRVTPEEDHEITDDQLVGRWDGLHRRESTCP